MAWLVVRECVICHTYQCTHRSFGHTAAALAAAPAASLVPIVHTGQVGLRLIPGCTVQCSPENRPIDRLFVHLVNPVQTVRLKKLVRLGASNASYQFLWCDT
jgi:hypothetical protein